MEKNEAPDVSDADQLLAALRGFDPNYLLIANISIGEFILCISRLQDRVSDLERIEAELQNATEILVAYGCDAARICR